MRQLEIFLVHRRHPFWLAITALRLMTDPSLGKMAKSYDCIEAIKSANTLYYPIPWSMNSTRSPLWWQDFDNKINVRATHMANNCSSWTNDLYLNTRIWSFEYRRQKKTCMISWNAAPHHKYFDCCICDVADDRVWLGIKSFWSQQLSFQLRNQKNRKHWFAYKCWHGRMTWASFSLLVVSRRGQVYTHCYDAILW